MASSAELWSRGARKWWISHEGADGPKGLSSDGELPSSLPPIREEMEQLQASEGGDEADVDYIFEIPLRVAQAIVGFKHDEEPAHPADRHFVILDRTEPPKGWRARLFG
jgi:hypothetical protein